MIVVRNQAKIGGSKRFRIIEYDDGGGLSKKAVIWLEIKDNSDG